MEDPVREGFICPFCMCDLGDFPTLQAHVENAHAEQGSDITDSVVQNFKDFFDKAKRGIKRIEKVNIDLSQVNLGVSNSVSNLSNYASSVQERVQERAKPARNNTVRPIPVKRPEIGVVRSHTDTFMKTRESRINESAVRTNMLIIRLDRLINECPSDPTKRKDFERQVVPWSADSESPVCRSCAGKFNLSRRRHHCRLCGRVMCHKCSRFLSFISARKLTNPTIVTSTDEPETSAISGDNSPSHSRKLLEYTQKTTGKMMMLLEGAVSKISNDSADGSLGSLLQQDASECLRVCGSCLGDLKRREEMMEQRVAPAVAEQYATLDKLLHEIASLNSTFGRMAYSINKGENMYLLQDAETMRQRVLRKHREIDVLSQNIVNGAEEEKIADTKLRRNIRYTAVQSMTEIASNMAHLPTAEQYALLVEAHKEMIAKQTEEARLLLAPERISKSQFTKESSIDSSTNGRNDERKNVQEEGYTPSTTKAHNPFLDEMDMQHPMLEQRDIIKGYLAQAISDGKLEEVEMLERNLKDLESEMRLMGMEL